MTMLLYFEISLATLVVTSVVYGAFFWEESTSSRLMTVTMLALSCGAWPLIWAFALVWGTATIARRAATAWRGRVENGAPAEGGVEGSESGSRR